MRVFIKFIFSFGIFVLAIMFLFLIVSEMDKASAEHNRIIEDYSQRLKRLEFRDYEHEHYHATVLEAGEP